MKNMLTINDMIFETICTSVDDTPFYADILSQLGYETIKESSIGNWSIYKDRHILNVEEPLAHSICFDGIVIKSFGTAINFMENAHKINYAALFDLRPKRMNVNSSYKKSRILEYKSLRSQLNFYASSIKFREKRIKNRLAENQEDMKIINEAKNEIIKINIKKAMLLCDEY